MSEGFAPSSDKIAQSYADYYSNHPIGISTANLLANICIHIGIIIAHLFSEHHYNWKRSPVSAISLVKNLSNVYHLYNDIYLVKCPDVSGIMSCPLQNRKLCSTSSIWNCLNSFFDD